MKKINRQTVQRIIIFSRSIVASAKPDNVHYYKTHPTYLFPYILYTRYRTILVCILFPRKIHKLTHTRTRIFKYHGRNAVQEWADRRNILRFFSGKGLNLIFTYVFFIPLKRKPKFYHPIYKYICRIHLLKTIFS